VSGFGVCLFKLTSTNGSTNIAVRFKLTWVQKLQTIIWLFIIQSSINITESFKADILIAK
jgi:hypothetical protein